MTKNPKYAAWEKDYRAKRRAAGLCSAKGCQAETFGKSYCPKHREAQRASYEKHRAKYVEQMRRKSAAECLRVLLHYGGKCAECGHENLRHLELHHKDHDGAEHRKADPRYNSQARYRTIIKDAFPDNLELLCANCHLGKHRNSFLPEQIPKTD